MSSLANTIAFAALISVLAVTAIHLIRFFRGGRFIHEKGPVHTVIQFVGLAWAVFWATAVCFGIWMYLVSSP